MASLKIVIIGGGSVAWTPHVATDLFMTTELTGSRLVLVDINPAAAELMSRYCKIVAERAGTGWTVEVADLEAALDGADSVCVSISTGSFEAMHHDVTIPEKYGVYHSVGDTVGPGGISRTLRNVPVFVNIARTMERLCPHAWLIHVTNPLAQITRCVRKATSIRSVGLCHNYNGTRYLIAKMLGVDPRDIDATSVGVNHFTWLKNITCKGVDVSDKIHLKSYLAYDAAKRGKPADGPESLEDAIARYTGEDSVQRYLLNFELHARFGVLPVGASSHVAENFGYYLNSPQTAIKHQIWRKGVLPSRADAAEKLRLSILARVEGREPMPELEQSPEGVAPVMAGLCTGKTCVSMVNLPNEGQIPNLPREVIVETWGVTTWDRVSPVMAGDVPANVVGMVQTIVNEEELAVEAALTGDRNLVIQAMQLSPIVANKDTIPEMVDELLAANAKWLPQFHRQRTHERSSVVV